MLVPPGGGFVACPFLTQRATTKKLWFIPYRNICLSLIILLLCIYTIATYDMRL